MNEKFRYALIEHDSRNKSFQVLAYFKALVDAKIVADTFGRDSGPLSYSVEDYYASNFN